MDSSIRVIFLPETDSTNSFLRGYRQTDGERITVVWTDFQTAGRGCGTNTWESEVGKNLTLSMLLCPRGVAARDQFIVSMANALALKETLDAYTDGITIKWPNDIYWHDSKLCGTLIETTLRGATIGSFIVGTGINVNQLVFHSDAPNPVSLRQILGHEVDREELLAQLTKTTGHYIDKVEEGRWDDIRTQYRAALHRRHEVHPYRLPDGTQQDLVLTDVEDDGHLLLSPPGGGHLLRFGFKEVQFVITDNPTATCEKEQ